jgi:Replication-relaxation
MPNVYRFANTQYIFRMLTRAKPKRRSHLVRHSLGKRIEINDKDVCDIFEPLSRHKQLTTRQLVSFGSRHPLVTKSRLGELWHVTEEQSSHWLHRVSEDLLFANHLTTQDMHRLGSEGAALLETRGLVPTEPWVSASRIGGQSLAPSKIFRLAHDHMASDICIDIEIGARKAELDFRNHLDILRSAPIETRGRKRPLRIPVQVEGRETFVEPDALFAIGKRAFALEADTGTESIRSVIVSKILAYREIVAAKIIDEYLGVDNLTVLFVTPSPLRMQHMMQALQDIARHGRSPMFAFRAEQGFSNFLQSPAPTGRLIGEAWSRVGCEDLILTG